MSGIDRKLSWIAAGAAALMLGLASPASATNITLDPAGDVSPSLSDTITFTVGFSPLVPAQSFDLTVMWDPTELALNVGSTNFIAGNLAISQDPVDDNPGGDRVAAVLFGADVGDLFSVDFTVVGITDDDQADFTVFVDTGVNGAGISPGELSIENPSGVSAYIVPEPGSLAFLGAGLLGLAWAGRRQPLRG